MDDQKEQVCALQFSFNSTILFPLRTWIGYWKSSKTYKAVFVKHQHYTATVAALEVSQTDQLQINLYTLQVYLAAALWGLCSTL